MGLLYDMAFYVFLGIYVCDIDIDLTEFSVLHFDIRIFQNMQILSDKNSLLFAIREVCY